MAPILTSPTQRRSRAALIPGVAGACAACGCARVRVDAVDDASASATLLLAECPRCDHRWTVAAAPRSAPLAPAILRARPEALSAA
jgi:hypothetical protein